jgi:hypothetical protein
LTIYKSGDEAPHQKRPRYINPFEGRAKRIHLSGLFLFDPDVLLRLRGGSMRTAFAEMGRESLFKGLERGARVGRFSEALKKELLELMPPLIRRNMRAAFDGSEVDADHLALIGPWEAYSLGAAHNEAGEAEVMPASMQFLCNVERASRRPTELCSEGCFLEASDALANDELMKHFMFPALLSAFVEAAKFEDLLLLRVTVALEVWLSLLALWDIEARPADIDDEGSHVSLLIPEEGSVGKNTIALLFDWLLRAAQVPTAAALAKDARLREISIDGGTLGAWSRGTNFPRSSYAKVISNALLCSDDAAAFKVLCAAARQLNFVGYIAQHCEEKIGRLKGASVENRTRPRLCLPFGHDTVESWLRGRYPFWLRFHRASLAIVSVNRDVGKG